MLTLQSRNCDYKVVPTKFPDGTSQVWNLPDWVWDGYPIRVTWHFEEEREVIDLMSLFKLLPDPRSVHLHIPYLPFGRQDKDVGNGATFNLHVMGTILGALNCGPITSVDVHNPKESIDLIPRLTCLPVTMLHRVITEKVKPTHVVFPDRGAYYRYSHVPFEGAQLVTFGKKRDPASGEITGLAVESVRDELNQGAAGSDVDISRHAAFGDRFLIVDDICDGGATFIAVAKKLRSQLEDIEISLCVTHGIFSKGRDHLHQNGIDKIYTTDSLLRNKGAYPV